jgi:hypothetical protein
LAAAAAADWRLAGETLRAPILEGMGAAWAASTVGACALILARRRSERAFLWSFGFGMALRAAVLAVLMAGPWWAASEERGAALASYALGVLGFLLLEYKNV